jgi:hypothetical protein
MKKNSLRVLLLCATIGLFTASCSSDKDKVSDAELEALAEQAKPVLTGDIVLNARVLMGEADMTKLESGCPAKWTFTWDNTDNKKMNIKLVDFEMVGYQLDFECDVQLTALNSFETNEYPGKGWIKFVGKDGHTAFSGGHITAPMEGNGSIIQGYCNVNTKEVNLQIDFNMMNVKANVFLQKIDKTRNYKDDMDKYLSDLAEWNKEHGTDKPANSSSSAKL